VTLSKSERILAAIEAVLAPTAGISGQVFRDRWEAVARNEMPCIVIEPLGESDEVPEVGPINTDLTFAVDVLVSGAPLSTLADPIRVDAHSRLMAEPFTGLGVIHVYPQSRQWQAEPGEIGILSCSYSVRYRSSLSDLTA
jgi:hypothetical protein